MSWGTEPVRNRHRPGMKTVDTREYSGPTKGGCKHKTDSDVLKKAREHKAKQGGVKYVDGVLATEFV